MHTEVIGTIILNLLRGSTSELPGNLFLSFGARNASWPCLLSGSRRWGARAWPGFLVA